jgi:hypothetical protein
MPRLLLWDNPKEAEYPGVQSMALKIKESIMAAHNTIITAQVKQTRHAHQARRLAPFTARDLVYLSTKNISLPRGQAHKLAPKYIGPYLITQELEPRATFALNLPSELKRHRLHNAFHASLLKIHVPNDDWRFPGWQMSQITGLGEDPMEWEVDQILSHSRKGNSAQFELKWKSGDITWETLYVIKHLEALEEYLQAMGIEKMTQLPAGQGKLPEEQEQVIFALAICLEAEGKQYIRDRKYATSFSSLQSYIHLPAMPFNISLSSAYFNSCVKYVAALRRYLIGTTESPGTMPKGYILYTALVHDQEVAPIPCNWDGLAPNSRLGPYNRTDPSVHPRECHRHVFISDWESGIN